MRNDETHLPEELPAGYQQRRSFQRTLIYDASLDPQLVDRIWESPAHVVSGGNILQTKERCQVARIPFRDQELLFKHHNWGGVWKSLGKVRVVPKARRAFLQAFKLLKAGIRTPRPLALAEGTFGRVGITSSLLTEYIPGTPLYHLIRGGQIANDRMGPLTDQIVELCERLASLCCAHNDLKPENLIVDHEDRVWLIDLENTRSYPGEEALSYWFSRDLDRLLRRRTWRFHPAGESLLRKKLTRAERVARIWSHQRPMSRLQPAGAPAAHSDPVLAAMILCEHSATDIERCVASVRDIADEIVLVAIGEAEILPALLAMTGCRCAWIGPQNRMCRSRGTSPLSVDSRAARAGSGFSRSCLGDADPPGVGTFVIRLSDSLSTNPHESRHQIRHGSRREASAIISSRRRELSRKKLSTDCGSGRNRWSVEFQDHGFRGRLLPRVSASR
jgi:hypothetical protein